MDEYGEIQIVSVKDKTITNIPMKSFVHSIAAVDDMLIAILSHKRYAIIKGINQIKIYNTSFNIEYCQSGINEILISGEGSLLIINAKEEQKIIKYPQRVGDILQITKYQQNYIIIGSSSPPIKLLEEPIKSNQNPSFSEMKLLSLHYPMDYLLELFDKEPFTAFILVLFNQWNLLPKSNGLISLIPILNEIPDEAASEILHSLIVQNHEIKDSLLKSNYSRKTFLKYPEDLKKLNNNQLMMILPPNRNKNIGQSEKI